MIGTMESARSALPAPPVVATEPVMTGELLVASDGLAATEGALRIAWLLGERDAVPVRVISVLEPLPVAGPAAELALVNVDVDDERRNRLVAHLRAQVPRVLGPTVEWPVDVVWGDPVRTIARLADESSARLVLLGLTQHSLLDRLLGGETALRVMHLAHVPVLQVAPALTSLPRRVVVGMDFSQESVAALRAAVDLADADATVWLVHVRPRVEMPPGGWEAWDLAYTAGLPTLFDRVKREVTVSRGVKLEVAEARGAPAAELLTFADHVDADLIAVASHGHSVIERLVIGSVTSGVVRASSRSVLVTPRVS
ncbi:MAG TPA: universal stress protein [Gemmatimonadaceae bacterium]